MNLLIIYDNIFYFIIMYKNGKQTIFFKLNAKQTYKSFNIEI